MDIVVADQNGIEIDILKERQYVDMDIGGNNDFEIHISNDLYKKLGINEGWRIGVPGKEYGGIVDKIKTMTMNNQVVLSGPTWRGILTKKVIEPPKGQDYRAVSGDAHTIINSLMCAEFDGIFVCDGVSGITVSNYKFDRYVDVLSGVEKMLLSKNSRINIEYDSGAPNAASFIRLSAVPIHDYSDELEYSQDGTLSFLSFTFERYTGGINHLICLGKGNLKDRLVIHLYVQQDGSIGNVKYYTGKDERTSVYDYSSCESAEELQEKGIERLKELMSYIDMDMDLLDPSLSVLKGLSADVAIGDIIGGRDRESGIYLSKQITRKILQIKNGRESIDYKVGGNTLTRSMANMPVEPTDAYQEQIDTLSEGLTVLNKEIDTINKDVSSVNEGLTKKIGIMVTRFDTVADIVNALNSSSGLTLGGRCWLAADISPTGGGFWCRCFAALQNAPNGTYGVSGQILAMDTDRCWLGYIGGTSSFTITWERIITAKNVPLTKLGNTVSGITFQYYKKGNVLTVYASGTLSKDLAAWGKVSSSVALPVGYRPLTQTYGGTSYPSMDIIVGISTAGSIELQRAANTAGGKDTWFGCSASYAVDC